MAIKSLLLTFCLIPTLLFSQEKDEKVVQEMFWGPGDSYKNVTDFPDKWKNESAVILYKSENYDFHKFGTKVTYTRSLRKRMKLMDNAAVEGFSEFSYKKFFSNSKGFKNKNISIVGLKIVKPNGKEEILNVDEEAVKVDEKYKVAIPNLEVGDIIDYYFYTVETFTSQAAEKFDPDESVIGEEYPIVDYKLFFETENDFFLTFKSFNGAPALQQVTSEKNNTRRYQLLASDIEKNDFPRWSYPMVQMPCYKYQVVFARKSKHEDWAFAFLPPKEDEVNSKVTKDNVLDVYQNRIWPFGNLGVVYKKFKKQDFKNKNEKIATFYYFIRHYFLTRYIEAFYAKEYDIYPNSVYLYEDPRLFEKNFEMFKYFTAICKDEKIPYEFYVSQKRYDGAIEDLLFTENINLIMKLNTEPPMYIDGFDPFSDINQVSPYVEGTKVYTLIPNKQYDLKTIETASLAVSTPEDNISETTINASLHDTFDGLKIQGVYRYKGHEKNDEQEHLLFSDFVYEDYKKYETTPFVELISNKKEKERVRKEMDALVADLTKKREDYYSNRIKESLEVDKVENYTVGIDSTGRFGKNQYMVLHDSYNISSFVKKAGPNYMVELGKLIGGQIHLEEEEKIRTEDVYMNFPKKLIYTVNFTIPEGYQVKGLENFIKKVDNKTGSFISTAEVTNGKLVIKAVKTYKSNYEPVANWPLMIEFLDTAYQFTNEKILLTK